jgi:hypothetical protein
LTAEVASARKETLVPSNRDVNGAGGVFPDVVASRLAFNAEPLASCGETEWSLVNDAEFEKAADAGFPVSSGADEFFERRLISRIVTCCGWSPTQPRSVKHARYGADETAFAGGKGGPPLLNFRMCCLHAREGKTGRGTKMGPYSKNR